MALAWFLVGLGWVMSFFMINSSPPAALFGYFIGVIVILVAQHVNKKSD